MKSNQTTFVIRRDRGIRRCVDCGNKSELIIGDKDYVCVDCFKRRLDIK